MQIKHNQTLIFGNHRSVDFTCIKKLKDFYRQNIVNFVEIDALDKSENLLHKNSFQHVADLIITSTHMPSVKLKTESIENEYFSFCAPMTGDGNIFVTNSRHDFIVNKTFFLTTGNEPWEATREYGSTLSFRINKTSIRRIYQANGGHANNISLIDQRLITQMIDVSNFSVDYFSTLRNIVSLIDAFDGNEKELRNIGLHDVIQRTILNILFYQDRNPDEIPEDIIERNGQNRSDRSVDILCDKIRQFPGHVMTLTEMQETTGLSGRSLQLAFNRRFGCTAREWQRNEHLGRAREMLTDSNNNQSVKQIAYTTGFSSLASFSRFYLARFGELPSATLKKK